MADSTKFIEKELDDFLDMVKKQLKNYALMMVEKKHHDMWHDLQQLQVENARMRDKLKEHQIIWEK